MHCVLCITIIIHEKNPPIKCKSTIQIRKSSKPSIPQIPLRNGQSNPLSPHRTQVGRGFGETEVHTLWTGSYIFDLESCSIYPPKNPDVDIRQEVLADLVEGCVFHVALDSAKPQSEQILFQPFELTLSTHPELQHSALNRNFKKGQEHH